ncbi:MAG: helix-turn-helix domain-containing protein [Propionibacteriales bacterium]|nr:helix-turn-helix domain-containing protein [Propionibacteriales bacterium]
MIDVQEAAGLASRTPETVRRWVWSGRLDARRQGRRLLVARDDVLRLIGKPDNSAPELTLHEWATQARRSRKAERGSAQTASDLVLTDREARSKGGTSDAGR